MKLPTTKMPTTGGCWLRNPRTGALTQAMVRASNPIADPDAETEMASTTDGADVTDGPDASVETEVADKAASITQGN